MFFLVAHLLGRDQVFSYTTGMSVTRRGFDAPDPRYAVPFLLLAFVGGFVGGVFKRWDAHGLYTVVVVSTIMLGGLAALVTWQRQWSALGTWFVDRSALTLLAGLPALLAVALAAGSFPVIRRANPRPSRP